MARLIFFASLFMTLFSSVLAATTSYLTLEGAAANTAAALQQNGLVLDSWLWGGSNSGVNAQTGQPGRATFGAVSISRKIDGNTPMFLEALGTAKRYTSFTISVVAPGPTGVATFPTVYTFTNVILTALDLSSDTPGDNGLEHINFVYSKVSIVYTDASKGGKVTTGTWNIQSNTARAISFEA